MKTATIKSRVLAGLEARPVTITATFEPEGSSPFKIAGFTSEAAEREARVRVISAISSLCNATEIIEVLDCTVTIDPPAPPGSAHLDLPIAVAVLAAMGRCEVREDTLYLGELALDGRVKPVRGVLPMVENWRGTAVVPVGNGAEAALSGAFVYDVEHLGIAAFELGLINLKGVTPIFPTPTPSFGDAWSYLRTTPAIRRALEVAAAGGHSVLLVGPPGSGKTLIARVLHSVLPPLSHDETIEVTKIHSVAGLVEPEIGYIPTRPFRSPHHTVSEAGMCGGGTTPRPGEVSLSHRGVLFLDELAEFRLGALDTLCRVLLEGRVSLGNTRVRATFPARPQLIASMNPCPCGYRGHPRRECRCTPERVASHWKRIEPFLSKFFDIRIDVPVLTSAELLAPVGEVEDPRERIAEAHGRRDKMLGVMTQEAVDTCLGLPPSPAMLNARLGDVEKAAKLARTIALLDDAEMVTVAHVNEAKGFTG